MQLYRLLPSCVRHRLQTTHRYNYGSSDIYQTSATLVNSVPVVYFFFRP